MRMTFYHETSEFSDLRCQIDHVTDSQAFGLVVLGSSGLSVPGLVVLALLVHVSMVSLREDVKALQEPRPRHDQAKSVMVRPGHTRHGTPGHDGYDPSWLHHPGYTLHDAPCTDRLDHAAAPHMPGRKCAMGSK